MNFEEWSNRLKDIWWQQHKNIFWAIKRKLKCSECGRTFTCEQDCEYWLFPWCSTDWKDKICICSECMTKA